MKGEERGLSGGRGQVFQVGDGKFGVSFCVCVAFPLAL